MCSLGSIEIVLSRQVCYIGFNVRPVYTMCFRVPENINVVVSGLVQDFGGEDQRKIQMQMHSGNGY